MQTGFIDIPKEWRVLNGLLDPRNVEWINRITTEVFTGKREDVFKAMQLAYREYGTITTDGIARFLQTQLPGELFTAQVGIMKAVVDEVVRLARKRQVFEAAEKLEKISKDHIPNEEEIRTVLDIPPVRVDEDSSLQSGAQAFLGKLHAKISGDYRFAHTGYSFLDRHMGNEWKPKSLVVIMADAGNGKTTLAINSMLRMAVHKKIATSSLLLSLEMSKEDLFTKWIADAKSIDSSKIQSGELTLAEMKVIETTTVKLQQLPMYVIDKGGLTLANIVYEIKRHVNKYGIRVVFIDYLQFINHHPTGNDNLDLGEIAEVLKELAKQLNITIVVLSQVSRGGEGMHKLRGSGEVEAVADVIFELEQTDDGGGGDVRSVKISFHKNRFGPVLSTACLFDGKYQRFIDGMRDEEDFVEEDSNNTDADTTAHTGITQQLPKVDINDYDKETGEYRSDQAESAITPERVSEANQTNKDTEENNEQSIKQSLSNEETDNTFD